MIANKFKSLSALSDTDLINRIDVLARKERELTLKLLLHLIEMDRRSLYLERGYSSLFDYCIQNLGYSEAAANRRIRCARCIRDYPEVYQMLNKNDLNLTTVSRLAGVISGGNKTELLNEARHKSKRQVEAIVARYNPKSLIPDRIRTVFLRTSEARVYDAGGSNSLKQQLEETLALARRSRQQRNTHTNWVKFTTAGGGENNPISGQERPALEKRFKLEFAVSPEVMAKIEKVKALLSTKIPKGIPLEQLLDALLDEYIEHHDPGRRQRRREKRKSKKSTRVKTLKEPAATSRNIPAVIKDRVYARDGGCCSYVSPDGVKCSSKWNLQIDHIVPFARGGDHAVSNLRRLCGRHNRLEAKRVFGRELMKQKIAINSRP